MEFFNEKYINYKLYGCHHIWSMMFIYIAKLNTKVEEDNNLSYAPNFTFTTRKEVCVY